MLRDASTEGPVRPGLPTWVVSVSLGELLGFCVPAAVGALMPAGTPQSLFVVTMVAAGTIEGTVLGLAQARVLARVVGIPPGTWVLATATGAALAWTAGMMPSMYQPRLTDLGYGSGLIAVATALVLLFSIGSAQWVVLRRHVERAGAWVWVTALAWCAGLAAFIGVTTPLWRRGQAPEVILGVGLMGGLAMAVSMALVTGLWLRRRHLL